MTKNKRFRYHHQDISFDRLIHIIYDSETQQAYSEENLKDVVDLLNNVTDEIEQIKKDLKVVLPVLLAIDFKMSINEGEAMNRLAKLLDDDFIKGVECE